MRLSERLQSLRVWLRNQHVSDDLIEKLLLAHTPTQIEKGFKALSKVGYPPDKIARTILRGRFGFRKGLKAAKAPPQGRPSPDAATGPIQLVPPGGGEVCDEVRREAQRLLEELAAS